jgi:hypothetical protein
MFMPDFTDQVRVLQNQTPIITLAAQSGVISAGGHGEDGGVQLSDKGGAIKASLHGGSGALVLREPPPAGAAFPIGQEAVSLTAVGSRLLLDAAGKHRIRLEGASANVWLGGNGEDGDLVLFAASGDNETVAKCTLHLDGGNGNIWLGGNGVNGDLVVLPSGATGQDTAQASIHLDGAAGDIRLKNADCAEDFDVAAADRIEPGTVLVIDQEGALRPSTEAYDRKVAGVVSGAGDCKPGIVLDKNPSQINRLPLALVGKVFCKVDTQFAAIEVGDLLTTSSTPGHAMKASDPLRAFGSVIGKALRPLNSGTGLIPILIALQ